jgi:hypothetical protein
MGAPLTPDFENLDQKILVFPFLKHFVFIVIMIFPKVKRKEKVPKLDGEEKVFARVVFYKYSFCVL